MTFQKPFWVRFLISLAATVCSIGGTIWICNAGTLFWTAAQSNYWFFTGFIIIAAITVAFCPDFWVEKQT